MFIQTKCFNQITRTNAYAFHISSSIDNQKHKSNVNIIDFMFWRLILNCFVKE